MTHGVRHDGTHRLDTGFESGQVESASGAFRILSLAEAGEPGPMDLVCRRTKVGPGDKRDDYVFRVRLPGADPLAYNTGIRFHRLNNSESLSWGRPAGGTNDLALTVLNAFLPAEDPKVAILAEAGQMVSPAAHRLHLEFAAEFLVTMPSSGGVVEETEIRAWIQLQEAMLVVDQVKLDLGLAQPDGSGNARLA